MDNYKWDSRKLLTTNRVIIVLALLPILYKLLGIADAVTLAVLTAISAAGGIYNVSNVLSKKYQGSVNDDG